MPSLFAEVWLRIYTKDRMFHGLIQAAYRYILKHLVSAGSQAMAASVEEAQVQEEEEGFDPSVSGGPAVAETAVVVGGDLDLQPIKVWQPGSPGLGDRPSMPRTFSRNVSTMSVMSASGLGVGSTGNGVERPRPWGGRRAFQRTS
ncbi:hypothetical protein J3R83DRAFT_11077 [Lanmaoa asiatica]|nr:hypothetical protein J3R83DRAFT_11077 [Lanmaoa asiatica]